MTEPELLKVALDETAECRRFFGSNLCNDECMNFNFCRMANSLEPQREVDRIVNMFALYIVIFAVAFVGYYLFEAFSAGRLPLPWQ